MDRFLAAFISAHVFTSYYIYNSLFGYPNTIDHDKDYFLEALYFAVYLLVEYGLQSPSHGPSFIYIYSYFFLLLGI